MNTNAAHNDMTLGRKALYSTLLAAGITVLGATAASALDLDLGGEDGLLADLDILGDTGVLADVGVPVTVENNSISIIGDSSTGSGSESTPAAGDASLGSTVDALLSIGIGDASPTGLIHLDLLDGVLHDHSHGPIVAGDLVDVWLLTPGQLAIVDLNLGDGVVDGIGVGDIANGTDVDADATVPVTVENNAISVIGDSSTGSGDATAGESTSILGDAGVLGGVNLLGTDGEGILNGTGVSADAEVPVTVTCNSVSVIGSSSSGCATAASTPTDPGDPGDEGEASTPGATGSGLAGTGAADVTGVMGVGALALLLGVAVTVIGRRFGVGA